MGSLGEGERRGSVPFGIIFSDRLGGKFKKCGVAEAVRRHFRAEERQSAFRMVPLYFKSSLPMKNEPGT